MVSICFNKQYAQIGGNYILNYLDPMKIIYGPYEGNILVFLKNSKCGCNKLPEPIEALLGPTKS